MNVMIVDDEVLTRTNVKYILEAEIPAYTGTTSYMLCGEAGSGAEALEKLPVCRPDIVLSDMRMPGMNGLELCETLHKQYPHIQFIALSNYDDYEYVRGTLQNGAVDYLLKHHLYAKELSEALDKARERICGGGVPLSQLSGNNTAALRREFLLHLLTGFYTDSQEVDSRIRTLELPLASSRILPIAMCLDDYRSDSLRNNDLTNYSIINIVSEILSDQKNGVICYAEQGNYAILLSFAHTFSENAVSSVIHAALTRIRTCMSRFLNLSVSFSIGVLCPSFQQLPEAFQAVSEQLQNRFYQQPGGIVESFAPNAQADIFNYFNEEKENTLTFLVLAGDAAGVQEKIDDLFGYIRNARPPLPMAQMLFTDLLGVLNRICKQQALDMRDIYTDDVLPEKHLGEMSSLSSVHNWFSALFARMCAALQARTAHPVSIYVKQATAYIHAHFCEDISLASAAHEVNVTNVYLSRLFKQELGIGFNEYLMQVRIKRAQLLLQQGKLSLRQIAECCGFQDYTYFLKVFKKQSGVTPKEYQRSCLCNSPQ